ncbi:hypothetical protein M1D88_17210 [Arthrobacter sp. R1-13]
MNSGLLSLASFGATMPGMILLGLGQTMVVLCLCCDLVSMLSVPRSHRRYIANTVFRTLAVPSILVTGVGVLMDAAFWAWMDVAFGTFIMVALVFRLHASKDEDNWWKGKGKKLAHWFRDQTATRFVPAPAAG